MRHAFVLLWSLFILAFPLLAQEDHQTARVEVAIGAELEVLTRDPDLVLDPWPGPHTRLTIEDPEPGVTREGSADAVIIAIANTMWARASASVTASNASSRVIAHAQPMFDLYNSRDTIMHVRLRVRVPGGFPEPGSPTLVPNPYYDLGTTDDNWGEVSQASQFVTVLSETESGAIVVVGNFHFTRPSIPPADTPTGPGRFDTFGVPFFADYSILVPPSSSVTETAEEIIIEFNPTEMGLVVDANAVAASVLGGVTKPIQFDSPSECESAPPSHPSPLTPQVRDPLCRVGRGVAAGPAQSCSCQRESLLGPQRCAFYFPDLFVKLDVPASARAGEKVAAEWSIMPWAFAGGEYLLVPELFAGGKWIPIGGKGKLDGKLSEGKEAKVKVAFTMPSTPTMIRARLQHLGKGDKQRTESILDARVALRRSKLQDSPK